MQAAHLPPARIKRKLRPTGRDQANRDVHSTRGSGKTERNLGRPGRGDFKRFSLQNTSGGAPTAGVISRES
jgi:hypothetical protein